MKKTKIICTVGSSVTNVELLTKMLQSGMDVACVNFSNTTREEQLALLELLQKARQESGSVLAILANATSGKLQPEDILFAARHGMDYVTATLAQSVQDVLAVRHILEKERLSTGIITKIDNAWAVEHIDELINVSDAIMVARRQLGEAIPMEEVPIVQKDIIARCNEAGKPVITTSQILESMGQRSSCTRAEANDVANAVYDGTDCVMLTDVTASGKYPLEAVQTIAKIVERTEKALDYDAIFRSMGLKERIHSSYAVSHAVVQISHEIDADAILTITEMGLTARKVAKYRPLSRIIAISRSPERVRAMQLYWGVTPLLGPYSADTDEMIALSLKCALSHKVIADGSTVVVTAGVPIGTMTTTNLIKVVTVGNKLVQGTGLGKKSVVGKVCNAVRVSDYQEKLKKGDVLVCDVLKEEFVPLVSKRASAIVCEEVGLTSTAAVVGITSDIPVIVGAAQATAMLWDGQLVTVDSVSGVVYEGEMNL